MPKPSQPVPLTLTWRDVTTCYRFCDPYAFRPSYVEGETEAAKTRRVGIFKRHGFGWDDMQACYVGNEGQKGKQRDPAGLQAALTVAGYEVEHAGTRVPAALQAPPMRPALREFVEAVEAAAELSERATNLEEMREVEEAQAVADDLLVEALADLVKRLAYSAEQVNGMIAEARKVVELAGWPKAAPE